MHLREYLKHTAQRFPNQQALVTEQLVLTYNELWERARRWAGLFIAAGVKPGQTIVVRTNHLAEFIAIEFGAWWIGTAIVPLDRGRSLQEVVAALKESDARALVSDPSILESVRQQGVVKVTLLSDVLPRNASLAPEIPLDHLGTVAQMLYTSGTSGKSKCVVWPTVDATKIIDSVLQATKFQTSDHFMTTLSPELPVVLVVCTLPAIAMGSRLHLSNTLFPGQITKALRQHDISVLLAVPYLYEMLCESTASQHLRQLEHLRVCISSGAPLRSEIFHRFHKLSGLFINSSYGLSEACLVTYNDAQNTEVRERSVGRALPGVNLSIRSSNGCKVPIGQEGELVIDNSLLGPNAGYLNRPKLQAQVYREGAVYTNDLAVMDQNGFVYLRGRLSETINSAGFSINPYEVEDVLISHPLVQDALVVGEQHDSLNQIVTATIVAHETLIETELLWYCQNYLASYKVPRKLKFVTEISRNEMGKSKRRC